MIEILEGFPGNVVAVRASGEVTRDDYERVLIPAVATTMERHDKVRVYYELGPGFTRMAAGAAWDDLKLGIAHYWHWEAIAVLTDHDWIRRAVDVFRFVVPGHIRTFRVDQASEARDWIVSPLDQPTTRPS
ncbi:STAS/SEC14 domain-containing protein [Cupriavidus sp. CP313]